MTHIYLKGGGTHTHKNSAGRAGLGVTHVMAQRWRIIQMYMYSSLSLYLSCGIVLCSHLNVTTETAGALSFTLAARPGELRTTLLPPFAVSPSLLRSHVPDQSVFLNIHLSLKVQLRDRLITVTGKRTVKIFKYNFEQYCHNSKVWTFLLQ